MQTRGLLHCHGPGPPLCSTQRRNQNARGSSAPGHGATQGRTKEPPQPQFPHSMFCSTILTPSQRFFHCTRISCSSLLPIFSFSDENGAKKIPQRGLFYTRIREFPAWLGLCPCCLTWGQVRRSCVERIPAHSTPLWARAAPKNTSSRPGCASGEVPSLLAKPADTDLPGQVSHGGLIQAKVGVHCARSSRVWPVPGGLHGCENPPAPAGRAVTFAGTGAGTGTV